jgi:hypothetical protein
MNQLKFELSSEDRKALASLKDAGAIRELVASNPKNPDISGYTDEEILSWVQANREKLLGETGMTEITLQELENVAGGVTEKRIC